jgi:hypothetical protein
MALKVTLRLAKDEADQVLSDVRSHYPAVTCQAVDVPQTPTPSHVGMENDESKGVSTRSHTANGDADASTLGSCCVMFTDSGDKSSCPPSTTEQVQAPNPPDSMTTSYVHYSPQLVECFNWFLNKVASLKTNQSTSALCHAASTPLSLYKLFESHATSIQVMEYVTSMESSAHKITCEDLDAMDSDRILGRYGDPDLLQQMDQSPQMAAGLKKKVEDAVNTVNEAIRKYG